MRQPETRMFAVPVRNDEVDIREMLFAGVSLAQKYRVAIVSIIIFGLSCGVLYHFLQPVRYSASFVCSVPYLGETDIKNMVEAIAQYALDGDRERLESDYGFRLAAPEALIGLSVDESAALKEHEGTTAYRFTATVIHPSQFAAVQTALTEALARRTQPFAEREQRLMSERIKIIDNGIAGARRMLEATANAGRQSGVQSVAELVDLEVRLSKEKADLLNREVAPKVSVLRAFGYGNPASDKRLLKVSLAAMLLSVFCAGLYVAVRELDVYIRKRKRGVARYESIFSQGYVSHN